MSATDVIGMLMGYQDGIDISNRDAEPFKASRHFAGPESRVDQDTGSPGFDQQAVSPAAAAE
jgi:hypothetical protein